MCEYKRGSKVPYIGAPSCTLRNACCSDTGGHAGNHPLRRLSGVRTAFRGTYRPATMGVFWLRRRGMKLDLSIRHADACCSILTSRQYGIVPDVFTDKSRLAEFVNSGRCGVKMAAPKHVLIESSHHLYLGRREGCTSCTQGPFIYNPVYFRLARTASI